MYNYYNPNPKGNKVGDCVIRAISKALDMSWEDVYIELTIQGYLMGDLLSSNGVWDAYLKRKGFDVDVTSNTIEEGCNSILQAIRKRRI